jgi:hypothetical protein
VNEAPAWGYEGRTTHVRFAPVRRAFAYRLFWLYLDIDRIADAQTRLFSYNRPNLFSFFDRDHGDRSGAGLRLWCERTFAEAGVLLEGGPIRLLTFPRMFGHVFNPLSIFFGFDGVGALKGVIYEVNNTFGETHSYAFAISEAHPLMGHDAAKRFHVSPFLDVEGCYRFALQPPGERVGLSVENWAGDALTHRATLAGRRAPLTDAALLRVLAALPFMTLGVVAAIHWQALRIWRAGVGYRPKPSPPAERVSFAGPAQPLSHTPKAD